MRPQSFHLRCVRAECDLRRGKILEEVPEQVVHAAVSCAQKSPGFQNCNESTAVIPQWPLTQLGRPSRASVMGRGLSRIISPLASHPFRRGRASVRGRRAGRHLMGFERIGRPIYRCVVGATV
jgi:hypothetical protein